ncbi:hypothetical protein [Streptomyces bauhiniae]
MNAKDTRPPALSSAVRVGEEMLRLYGDSTGYDMFAYAQAHGGLREALRILLRALGGDEKGTQIVSTPGGDQQRCPAAHPDDPSSCGGPVVVTVLDTLSAGLDGCEHHGARLLVSLAGGRVYALPDAPGGAAIRTFKAAATLRPFPWEAGR